MRHALRCVPSRVHRFPLALRSLGLLVVLPLVFLPAPSGADDDAGPVAPWLLRLEADPGDAEALLALGDLLVDVHEITEGHFLTFLAETARTPEAALGIDVYALGDGDLPAATLTPALAEAYAAWARKRLPTRSEWRRAAHVGETPFPWGDEPVAGRAVAGATLTGRDADRWDRRRSVGSLPDGASPEGVLDLVGNVCEWCADGPEAYPAARWLVGGDADLFHDVETAEDFRDSLDGLGWPSGELTLHAYAGACCVAERPDR